MLTDDYRLFIFKFSQKLILYIKWILFKMQSIVKFGFHELVYRCVLNHIGRRRYGTLEQLLQTDLGVPSTVGLQNGNNVPMPEFRNSTKFNTLVEFGLDSEDVTKHLEMLLDEDDVLPHWMAAAKYDVIEYNTGGFFKEHQDKQIKSTHYGTLLIFPPAVGPFAHTGGDLILDKGRFIFSSSKNKQWTFIAFHTHLPHECLEVLSGKRVVLKTELFGSRPVGNMIEPYLGLVDGNLPYYRELHTD